MKITNDNLFILKKFDHVSSEKNVYYHLKRTVCVRLLGFDKFGGLGHKPKKEIERER